MANQIRVLIGSPIQQKATILREFLTSLKRLNPNSLDLGYLFVNDNVEKASSDLLQTFADTMDNVILLDSIKKDCYICNDETTHLWNEQLTRKVASFKDVIIQRAIELSYDYLFLVDSDLVLHPNTLLQLIRSEKDIISEIFWTKWWPQSKPSPQVWLTDQFTQWHMGPDEHLTEQEVAVRKQKFIDQLKVPGLYEVGGLGACTLISRKALTVGVRFEEIKNIPFFGEDRDFCIRAAVLGLSMYVDTHYPAFHIYKESDLEDARKFLEECGNINTTINTVKGPLVKNNRPKLTLSMVIKDDTNQYLQQVLQEHRKYIDKAVIIDDSSSNYTIDTCLSILEGVPIHLIKNQSSSANEVDLRKQQWEQTIITDPDWILNLNSDELFESRFIKVVHSLLEQKNVDVFCFRLFEFWKDEYYREDQHWRSHLTYRPYLVRYKKNFHYTWSKSPLFSSRFPENIVELPHLASNLRLKHFGWLKHKDRLKKMELFRTLNFKHVPENREKYLSALDEKPNLVKWVE